MPQLSLFYDLQIQVFQLEGDEEYNWIVVQDFSEAGDEEVIASGAADRRRDALEDALDALQNHLRT